MPTHKQGMFEPRVTTRGLGPIAGGSSSDSAQIASAFPASPIHNGSLKDEAYKALAQTLLLDGVVNDSGHTFGEASRDYSDAPDLNADVDTGAFNIPSPYVPNPTSPGPGSLNASDKPAPPDGFGQTPANNFGTGVGSQLQPAASSAAHSTHNINEAYVMGKGPGGGA